MARTSQEQTQERHAFLIDLFRTQPELSRNEAMDAYKDKFGASINLKTFSQLRDQIQKELAEMAAAESAEPETTEETPAPAIHDPAADLKSAASSDSLGAANAAPAKKPKAKGPGSRNVFVDAPQEHLVFLERIVNQLQEAGASNLRIDHSTDRWMVLVVDAK
ncbi:hypothetical protein DRW03_25965 [Corallococcus sp. H22C18031201]|nr:hypothetical protein DRW03_25965 [Corallococcus sp. H22C18031201]